MSSSQSNKKRQYLIRKEYRKTRNQWIRLTVMATGIPSFFSVLIGLFFTSNVLKLVGNGDILLSLFALMLMMLNDVFEGKSSKDEQMSKAYTNCILVLFAQLGVYFGIKYVTGNLSKKSYPHNWFLWPINSETDYYILFTVFTVILCVITIATCISSIKAIYRHKRRNKRIAIKRKTVSPKNRPVYTQQNKHA